MRQIGTIQIGHSQFAEDIVKDRRRILDAVVALNHACWLKLRECERVNEFLERHAVLKTNRHRDGKVVHHRAEACALFVHINKDFTKVAVFVFARTQVHFVATDDGFLRIAFTTLRHLFAFAVAYLLDDDLFDHLLGQNCRFFLRCTAFKCLSCIVIIFDQSRSQRLRQF